MRRPSHGTYDEEAARREPLLGAVSAGGNGGGGAARTSSDDAGAGTHSRPLSPELWDAARGSPPPSSPPRTGSIRLKRTAMAQGDAEHGLVVKDGGQEDVREVEVEVVAGAVAEAVAEAVQDAVQEAVHDAVQQAIEENVTFDVRANVYTLIAVTGVILFWRGVWNSWDSLFGTELASNIGSMAVGLVIMCVIRWQNLPLVEGLPGG